MNILTAVLIMASLGALVGVERSVALLGVLLCTLFIAAYTSCIIQNRYAWQPLVSMVIVLIVWIIMLPIIPVSVYLVFPIFFLCLRLWPDARGIIGVLGAMLVAIISQWPHLTIGAIMGPAVSALVCIGIHLTFKALWKASRERESLIEQLLQTQQQLAETERAAGIASERQRIAHEIHDTLAQGLSSIQMLLRVAEQEIKKSSLSQQEQKAPLERMALARRTAADNLSEARAMIAALQPAALSKTSLEGALHRAAEHIVGPEVIIEVEGEEQQLPMRTEAALLRIAQGALGNVAKHSQASLCHVTLSYAQDEVRLDVVDNGQGFDPEKLAAQPAGLGHIGISAMRQRAQEQGGNLVVESTPGEGTAISVALPVEA
ncbi:MULTISPECIES: sensor histidine kinase [unclassified Corynebacterium]|nr:MULTISPECIES: sensor histidine kinase [unclassified Corynebacterium]